MMSLPSSSGRLCYSRRVSSLYYFTGKNTFLLREERRKWKEGFLEKHGGNTLLTLDASSLHFRTLLDEVSAAPFLADKRLVIIDGTPKFSSEEMEVLEASIHPDCLVLFCDPHPDKRLGGTKFLLKHATVKEFPALDDRHLSAWIHQYAAQQGNTFDDAAARALLAIVGEEQEMLAREIEKIATAKPNAPVNQADVRTLAVPSGDQEIWQLTSLLSQGKTEDALRYASALLLQGEDAYSLWSILLWMLRNLIGVFAAAAEGERNPAAIASSMGVPFPTVRTLLPFADKLDATRLRLLVDWAVETDIALKTGGYKATGEAPQELLALLDELIIRCGELSKA